MHHRLMETERLSRTRPLTAESLERSDVFADIGATSASFLSRPVTGHAVERRAAVGNRNSGRYANLLANGRTDVEVYPLGLSGQAGVETLHESPAPAVASPRVVVSQRFKKTIPVSTLDILLGSRFQGQKMFIKLDVEGFEYQVLLGCTEVLAMQPKPTWMVEICLSDHHP